MHVWGYIVDQSVVFDLLWHWHWTVYSSTVYTCCVNQSVTVCTCVSLCVCIASVELVNVAKVSEKHVDTGYFVFGGRMFNSLQEEYQQEEILEGVRLGSPLVSVSEPCSCFSFFLLLLQEVFLPPSRMQYPLADLQDVPVSTPHGRRPSTIITRDRPGDKAGLMLLRKGIEQ